MSRSAEDAELLAVVDAGDQVVGTKRRDDIHCQNLPHRAIHVLVFNPQGDIFLQQRGLHKQENPGLWDSSVAGHVDAGEEYDQCCVREVAEEIGLSLETAPARLFKLEASVATGMEFAWVYRLDTPGPLKLNLDEMLGGSWFSPEAIDDWIRDGAQALSDVFELIWTTYRAQDYQDPF